MNIKTKATKNIVNGLMLNNYKQFAYTEIFKQGAKDINSIISAEQFYNNGYNFKSEHLKTLTTIASVVYTEQFYNEFCAVSNNKLRDYANKALRACVVSGLFTDLTTLRAEYKQLNYEHRARLNSFMKQLAYIIKTDDGSKAIKIKNSNYAPKA